MSWWHGWLKLRSAARGRLLVIPLVLVGFLPHALLVGIYLGLSPAGVWQEAVPWNRVLLKAVLSIGAPVSMVAVWMYGRPSRRIVAVYDWLGGGLLSLAFVWLGSLTQDLLKDHMLDALGRLLIHFGTAVWGGIGIGLMLAGTAYLSGELRNEQMERQRLEALMEFTRQITSLDYQSVLDSATKHLHRLLKADSCVLYLWDQEDQSLVPAADVHDMSQYTAEYVSKIRSFRCPLGFGLTGWVMRSGEPYITGNVVKDPKSQAVPGWKNEEKSCVLAPIRVEGRRLGVVRLTRRGLHQFSDEDLELVQSFAGQAALVLEHARIVKELSELSITDALTGLYNSRHFHNVLEVETKRAERHDQPLSLIMADSDALKRVNDLYGHQQGDEHIRAIGQVLKAATRQTDFVFRYAGDEFIVLLPNTGPDEAAVVAERICRSMAERALPGGLRATLSIGVASLPTHARDGRSLMAAADQAMYESKRSGKNRVTMAGAHGVRGTRGPL